MQPWWPYRPDWSDRMITPGSLLDVHGTPHMKWVGTSKNYSDINRSDQDMVELPARDPLRRCAGRCLLPRPDPVASRAMVPRTCVLKGGWRRRGKISHAVIVCIEHTRRRRSCRSCQVSVLEQGHGHIWCMPLETNLRPGSAQLSLPKPPCTRTLQASSTCSWPLAAGRFSCHVAAPPLVLHAGACECLRVPCGSPYVYPRGDVMPVPVAVRAGCYSSRGCQCG